MSSVPRFIILVSPDSYLLKQSIQDMEARFSPAQAGLGGQGYERHIFWGDDGVSSAFWEHLTLQGLFAQPKVLVLRNTQAIPTAGLKELSQGLQRAPDSVLTILCLEVGFEKGAPKIPAHIQKLPCYLYAKKNNWITTLQPLGSNTLPAFIKSEAKRLGVTIAPQLMPKLTAALPMDAAAASCEMEKLALTADPQGHIPESALHVVEQNLESDIFQLLHTLETTQDKSVVWRQLTALTQTGESPIFGFLSSLTREARALWQLSMGEQPSLPPFIINAKRAVAQSLGPVAIAKLWDLALKAERSIKSGEQSPEQAFDILVAELSLIFHPRAAHTGYR